MNVSAAGLSLVALVTLLGVVSALYEEDLDYLEAPDSAEQLTSEKRYYMSSSCRRCLHQPNDYSACITCYSRPGSPTPYYGKRAFDDQFAFLPDESHQGHQKRAFDDQFAFLPEESHQGHEKRARAGAITPYYGKRAFDDLYAFLPYDSPQRHEKRAFDDQFAFLPEDYSNQMAKRGSFMACKCCLSLGRSRCCDRCGSHMSKRGYTTSFVGLDRMSSCSCCSPNLFDFGCCIRCRSRK